MREPRLDLQRMSSEDTMAALREYAEAAAEHGKDSPQAQRIRNAVVVGNLPLALHVGRRWIACGRYTSAEVISIGATGLVRAVERFDLARDTKFSTYACWWIRAALNREHGNTGSEIRVPIHAQESKTKSAKIREAASAARKVYSLDRPLDADSGNATTFGDQLVDDGALDAFREVFDRDEHAALRACLASLPADERWALEAVAAGETLAEAAREMGCTRETLRARVERARGRVRRAMRDAA